MCEKRRLSNHLLINQKSIIEIDQIALDAVCSSWGQCQNGIDCGMDWLKPNSSGFCHSLVFKDFVLNNEFKIKHNKN